MSLPSTRFIVKSIRAAEMVGRVAAGLRLLPSGAIIIWTPNPRWPVVPPLGVEGEPWGKGHVPFIFRPGHDFLQLPTPWVQEPVRPPRGIKASVRARVWERDGQRCTYCGSVEGPFHLDHVHPVSRGGGSDFDNLTVACSPCNLSKGAKTVREWKGDA